MSSETTTPWYQTNFDLLEAQLNGERSGKFHQARSEAHGELLKVGLPKAKDEDWKYTSTREIEHGGYDLVLSDVLGKVEKEAIDKALSNYSFGDFDCYELTLIDGYYSKELSADFTSMPKGVEVQITQEREFANREGDAVLALNGAFISDCVVVTIDKNVKLDKPIYIKNISSGVSSNKSAQFSRVIFELGESAEGEIVEHFVSLTPDVAGFTSTVAEISAAANARATYYQIGEESKEQIRVSRIIGEQGRDANINTHSYSFGGKIVRNEVHPTLNGENGFTGMYGLSVLNEKQHVDNHTVLDHAVPHCESDERYKGIYDGSSTGVFCGTIIVRPDAQKTNAIQNNQGLLLSDRASLKTKPQLKIWADDVKCTHGATVGQLDSDQMFYLRSRGVGEIDARNMLVRAFAGEVTQEIGIAPIREYVEEKVVEKLSL